MNRFVIVAICALVLLLGGCACQEQPEPSGVEATATPAQTVDTEHASIDVDQSGSIPTPFEYQQEESINELGLLNNPDTDSTPEPKMSYEQYQNINPDVVGFISIPNTEIEYPILHTDSNYYINHSPQRERSDYGAIYIDPRCSLEDSYLIIYGHNMKNGTMFAGLHNYSDRDFFYATPDFTIIFGDEVRTYRVFSTYVIDLDTDYPTFYSLGITGEDYIDFLIEQQRRSTYSVGVSFAETSEVVALCTCNRASYENGREIVLAVRVG